MKENTCTERKHMRATGMSAKAHDEIGYGYPGYAAGAIHQPRHRQKKPPQPLRI
jgi:hypothetical protein